MPWKTWGLVSILLLASSLSVWTQKETMRLKKGRRQFFGRKKRNDIDIIGKKQFRTIALLNAYAYVLWLAGTFNSIVAKHWFEIECLAYFRLYVLLYIWKPCLIKLWKELWSEFFFMGVVKFIYSGFSKVSQCLNC